MFKSPWRGVQGRRKMFDMFSVKSYHTISVPMSWDTYNNESSPNNNAKFVVTIDCRGNAGSRRITIAKPDLSSIPAGAVVISATLRLYNVTVNALDRSFFVGSILVANSAVVEDCTWNFADGVATRWAGDAASDGGVDAGCSISGTDYNAAALGTVLYTGTTAANTLHEANLSVSKVQSWIDTGNYGFCIIFTDALTFQWHSLNSITPEYRPTIEIVYAGAPPLP